MIVKPSIPQRVYRDPIDMLLLFRGVIYCAYLLTYTTLIYQSQHFLREASCVYIAIRSKANLTRSCAPPKAD